MVVEVGLIEAVFALFGLRLLASLVRQKCSGVSRILALRSRVRQIPLGATCLKLGERCRPNAVGVVLDSRIASKR